MPWNPSLPANIRTVHLGEFSPTSAARIAERLDAAGIVWWTKEPGFLSRFWQLGIEMFVDRARLDEARAIADAVAGAP